MKPKALFLAVTIHITFYLLHLTSSAQDIHFSQSTMTPLLLNPASTGFYGGTHRASLNYKNQWRGLGTQGAAFNTALFSYDAALLKNKWHKGYLGAGILCYRDAAGDLKMGTTQINISLAGILYITQKQSLSGGLQGGYVQKSISAAAMQWEDQYDAGTGAYNASLLSNDIAAVPPTAYGNFSAGISWNYTEGQSSLVANDHLKINIGCAAHNVNTPKQSFTAYGNKDELYAKFIIHGNALAGIKNTNFALAPNILFSKQGPSFELNIGTLVRWTIKDESKYTGIFKGTAFSAGAHYRLKDALIPVLLLEYANYAIGISYDVNVSGLTKATQGQGGFELSLRFLNPNPFHSALRIAEE